jgi:transposase
MKRIKFVGLDVHAETIAVAVAEQEGEVRSLGVIPNREESIRKLVKKLGLVEQLRFCYEAGPTGYVVYWQLTALEAKCEVVAPTLVPVKSGERVKTDRRDALKLARNYRAGELTPVWVPDAAHEALRDLVRAREAAKKDQLRAKHRLSKFLLRHGRRPPTGVRPWTLNYLSWVKHEVRFEQMAQEATLLDYLHEVEAAWAYRHRPNLGETLRKRQEGVSEEIREIAWKAQHRLHARYRKLIVRGKVKGKVVTAIGRELLGFIWAVGVQAEAAQNKTEQRAA